MNQRHQGTECDLKSLDCFVGFMVFVVRCFRVVLLEMWVVGCVGRVGVEGRWSVVFIEKQCMDEVEL